MCSTNTNTHFNKLGAGYADEWHTRFTSDSLCWQCFTCQSKQRTRKMRMLAANTITPTHLSIANIPVLGGPSKITPGGILHPFFVYASGCFKKSTQPQSIPAWLHLILLHHERKCPYSESFEFVLYFWQTLKDCPVLPWVPFQFLHDDSKRTGQQRVRGKMRLCNKSVNPLATSCEGSTITSTLCLVSWVNKSGSLGRASRATQLLSMSTPSSCVLSLKNITFSMRSAWWGEESPNSKD